MNINLLYNNPLPSNSSTSSIVGVQQNYYSYKDLGIGSGQMGDSVGVLVLLKRLESSEEERVMNIYRFQVTCAIQPRASLERLKTSLYCSKISLTTLSHFRHGGSWAI